MRITKSNGGGGLSGFGALRAPTDRGLVHRKRPPHPAQTEIFEGSEISSNW